MGVVLVYPALCLSLAASISRTVFNHDPVLNFPSTALCLNSYVPEDRRSVLHTYLLVPRPVLVSATIGSHFNLRTHSHRRPSPTHT